MELHSIHLGANWPQIDAARLKSVRGSPVMDAIERCLDILDDNSMKDLVPCLENAMRQAVGMPSKVSEREYPEAWYPEAWYPEAWYPEAWYPEAWYPEA